MRKVDNFAFLRVRKAGHMVPLDQAKNAYLMFKNFITKDTEPELIAMTVAE